MTGKKLYVPRLYSQTRQWVDTINAQRNMQRFVRLPEDSCNISKKHLQEFNKEVR